MLSMKRSVAWLVSLWHNRSKSKQLRVWKKIDDWFNVTHIYPRGICMFSVRGSQSIFKTNHFPIIWAECGNLIQVGFVPIVPKVWLHIIGLTKRSVWIRLGSLYGAWHLFYWASHGWTWCAWTTLNQQFRLPWCFIVDLKKMLISC